MSFSSLYYQNLVKSALQPPDWIFAPVWSVLYFLMFISFILILDKKGKIKTWAITFFILQLIVNFLWPYIFFGLNEIKIALFILVLLIILVITTAVLFFKLSKISGLLFIPYILWSIFALFLNYEIVILNP